MIARAIPVYASEALPVAAEELAALNGSIALLHSARAATRLGELVDGHGLERSSVAVAAFSPAVSMAAGTGWAWIVEATTPDDAALIEAAIEERRARD